MFKLINPAGLSLKMNNFRSSRTCILSQNKNRMLSHLRFPKNNYSNYKNKNYVNSRRIPVNEETPNVSLALLGILGVSSLYLAAHKPILNDSAGYANAPVSIKSPGSANIYYDEEKPMYDGAFGGRLNYHQISMGSMTGLVLGYAISRLSSVLFVFTIAFYLIGIYLRKQGIVIVDTKGMVKGAVNSISWDELVFGQTSFSVPFITSFFIAATL